ncbi:hypothetical protein STEG23_005018 [Scotinomys teguina]
MVKVGVNECGLIGFLVTKNVTASGKVKVIAIEDPFIDLNNMVYMFQYWSLILYSRMNVWGLGAALPLRTLEFNSSRPNDLNPTEEVRPSPYPFAFLSAFTPWLFLHCRPPAGAVLNAGVTEHTA